MFKRTACVCLILTGCSGAIEDPVDGSEEESGVTESPVVNGTLINEEYSGIVALQSNSEHSSSTFCTGVLITNTKVLTLASCASAPLPWVRMGSQMRRTASVKIGPTSSNVGLITLNAPMLMPYLGLPYASGYRRSIRLGSASSLDGVVMYCSGFGGPDSTAAFPTYSLKRGKFYGQWESWTTLDDMRLMADPLNNNIYLDLGKDRGAACTLSSGSNSTLAAISDSRALENRSTGERWTLLIEPKRWLTWLEQNL